MVVDLRRPAAYFLAVTASPSLAVVPPSMIGQLDRRAADGRLGRVPAKRYGSDGVIHLSGNPNYWAGLPPLDQIDLVTDFGGTSGVQLFTDGDIDYTGIGAGDASWIAYDATLGPQLRQTESFGVSYYGFSTQVAPFDDPMCGSPSPRRSTGTAS